MVGPAASRRKPTPAALDALWDFDDPRSSEARFREFIGRVRRPTDTDLRAEALTQLARSQGLQRKFGPAHRTLDTLVPSLSKLGARARVRYSLERGRVFNSEGAPGKALPQFLDAWRRARHAREDRLAVDAAHMVAIVKSGAAQRTWNSRALELAERSRDPAARRWRASLLNNIGWSWFGSENYRAALVSFRRAVRLRQQQRVAAETRIARWCVAKTLRMLGRTEEALRLHRRLSEDWRRAGGKDGYVYEEMGECLLVLGRSTEARGFFRRAYGELSKDGWLVANEPKRLDRLRRLGSADPRGAG
jgi:tetratricopeptide (TPR) repeat protein